MPGAFWPEGNEENSGKTLATGSPIWPWNGVCANYRPTAMGVRFNGKKKACFVRFALGGWVALSPCASIKRLARRPVCKRRRK